ncbi:unnamed protein product [Meloidogyne enterolobii]|uniref:Uncharacterized protein n=1 Tax=Meloidogyne enterolobii TaxID=390850 RepID=A0ACB0YTW0_MELEN
MSFYFISILLFLNLTFVFGVKTIPDKPPNFEYKMDKNSNLKIEKIKVNDASLMPLKITLKFVSKELGIKYFFTPIDSQCEEGVKDNQEMIRQEEDFKNNFSFIKELSVNYLKGFRLCSNIMLKEELKLTTIHFVKPLFSDGFMWKEEENKSRLFKRGVLRRAIKRKNGAIILEEFEDILFSFVGFRYQNWMGNSLDVYVQVREPGYYKMLINRIEDECNITKTSKIHESENELPKTAAVSLHGRFKPNGFEGGFVICIQFVPSSKGKGIIAGGVEMVAGGAQMIGKTVIEGAQSAVEEGAKMAAGGVNIVANTVTGGAHFVADTVTDGAHSVVGTVSDGAHLVAGTVSDGARMAKNTVVEGRNIIGGALTSGRKKIAGLARNASTIPSGIFPFNKRGKRASSSSSSSAISESPKNASKEKSKEKREKNPYKIIAKVLPAFQDGFEKKFLPEEI